ncbi:MAG: SGNH/GDSL hydrolase family protein [Clostridia bacterium]|nr:SGNH/GDSL hydrolase family protein [Clostridia bacterium]
MELKGLTVNFLGDSITEGCGTSGREKVYHQIIKEKYGMKHAYNYGVGGTRIARQVVPTKDMTICDLTFELRAEIMDKNADAVVVFGGTNDFGHGDAPFGTEDSEDVYTFCGAVNSLIKKLKSDFPNAKIVFMTPIHRVTENEPSNPDAKVLKDYVEAICAICQKHNIPVIDLFKINPLDPHNPELVPDGLHPGDKGHIIMADVIAEALMKL